MVWLLAENVTKMVILLAMEVPLFMYETRDTVGNESDGCQQKMFSLYYSYLEKHNRIQGDIFLLQEAC